MQFKLEQLEYQEHAIQSVIKVFEGQTRNTFDNACYEGIRSNYLSLLNEEIDQNIKALINENGISEETANISDENDLCIEMETGTGKTLVYIKTIYELYKHYNFTKFIILVPSVAIKEGALKTFEIFEKQLDDIYGFKPSCFEYDSKRLNQVQNFIEE
ncbi:MAG: DEAD/DEAH box helicase family protein [Spirochaetes bacterium]|nr:DEAD/DEAH box helicase family protein [Spirochaetota bacterium]